jgi:hypothetical protein
MTPGEQVLHQEKLVSKVIDSHGFGFKGIDCTLYAILTLKAMQNGIKNPWAWASEQIKKLNESCLTES